MSQTKEGAKKLRKTMIAKYGSEEAWKEHMRNIGSKGGTETHKNGWLAQVNFAADRDRARIAGAKGGRISKRGKAKDVRA